MVLSGQQGQACQGPVLGFYLLGFEIHRHYRGAGVGKRDTGCFDDQGIAAQPGQHFFTSPHPFVGQGHHHVGRSMPV